MLPIYQRDVFAALSAWSDDDLFLWIMTDDDVGQTTLDFSDTAEQREWESGQLTTEELI